MATILDILMCLEVEVWADGDRLFYRAPEGTLSPHDREMLIAWKAEILKALQDGNRGHPRPPPRDPGNDAFPPAWFEVGFVAPTRACFLHDPVDKVHPRWWDYQYELHNRGLVLVDGVVQVSPNDTPTL